MTAADRERSYPKAHSPLGDHWGLPCGRTNHQLSLGNRVVVHRHYHPCRAPIPQAFPMDHIQPVSGGQFFKGDGQCGGVIPTRPKTMPRSMPSSYQNRLVPPWAFQLLSRAQIFMAGEQSDCLKGARLSIAVSQLRSRASSFESNSRRSACNG